MLNGMGTTSFAIPAMLLRHVVPNNGAPSEFDAITHAGKTLDRLLSSVKGRRSRCHDSAAIMDARLEKTWLIPVIGGCLYIPVVTKYNHVRLIRTRSRGRHEGEG